MKIGTVHFERLKYFQADPLTFLPTASEKGLILGGELPLVDNSDVPVSGGWSATFCVRLNQAMIAYSRMERYRSGNFYPDLRLESELKYL